MAEKHAKACFLLTNNNIYDTICSYTEKGRIDNKKYKYMDENTQKCEGCEQLTEGCQCAPESTEESVTPAPEATPSNEGEANESGAEETPAEDGEEASESTPEA